MSDAKDREIARLKARYTALNKKYRWLRQRARYNSNWWESPPQTWVISFRSYSSRFEYALKQAMESDDE